MREDFTPLSSLCTEHKSPSKIYFGISKASPRIEAGLDSDFPERERFCFFFVYMHFSLYPAISAVNDYAKLFICSLAPKKSNQMFTSSIACSWCLLPNILIADSSEAYLSPSPFSAKCDIFLTSLMQNEIRAS